MWTFMEMIYNIYISFTDVNIIKCLANFNM